MYKSTTLIKELNMIQISPFSNKPIFKYVFDYDTGKTVLKMSKSIQST